MLGTADPDAIFPIHLAAGAVGGYLPLMRLSSLLPRTIGDWTPAVLLVLSGCAGPTQAPEFAQPTPDYPPLPSANIAERSAAPEAVPTSAPSSAQKHKSPLSERYKSQKALSTLEGKATYYGDSLSGNKTANGERYSPREFTAAHKKLPFGTVVRVIRLDTGKSTYVRINDRGPFGAKDRIIDLSRAAAEELEMIRAGVVRVKVEILTRPDSA